MPSGMDILRPGWTLIGHWQILIPPVRKSSDSYYIGRRSDSRTLPLTKKSSLLVDPINWFKQKIIEFTTTGRDISMNGNVQISPL